MIRRNAHFGQGGNLEKWFCALLPIPARETSAAIFIVICIIVDIGCVVYDAGVM